MQNNVNNLKPGQPVKFRPTGYTQWGRQSTEKLTETFIVKNYIDDLIVSDRKKLNKIFDEGSVDVKTFIAGIDVDKGKTPTVIFVPEDFPIPEFVKEKISKAKNDIEEFATKKEDFQYGIVKISNEYGYQEVYDFRLGLCGHWGNIGSFVVCDPTYAYEFEPITTKEFLEGFSNLIKKFDDDIINLEKEFPFDALLKARQKFYLQSIYKKIENAKTEKEIDTIMLSDNTLISPSTGFYAILLEKIIILSRHSEEHMVAKIYSAINKEDTKVYQAIEIPKEYLYIINDMECYKLTWSYNFLSKLSKNKDIINQISMEIINE